MPSNQALLDYLALHFIEGGWSIKKMHREILLSHAYQLSTEDNAADAEIDGENDYFWHHLRTRLDAEEVRDSMLADSGLLDRSTAGMHPFPPQSKWNWEEQAPFIADLSAYETDRRSVYMMIQRRVRNPYMLLFDGADTHASTDKRGQSLTPLQALYFMNSAFPRRCADAMVKTVAAPTQKQSIENAFAIIYSRSVAKDELDEVESMLQKSSKVYQAHGETKEAAEAKAMSHFIRAMYSSNEFMFVE